MSISLAILGSTGSVGENTLQVLREQKAHQNKFRVSSLAAASQMKKLAAQCAFWRPQKVSVGSPAAVNELKQLLGGEHTPQILCGDAGLETLAEDENTDWVVNALSGGEGLRACFPALQSGKRLLLANKESLVSAGDLLMKIAREHNTQIIPLDSEHNAVLRCLPPAYNIGEDPRNDFGLRYITLTASGGPFLNYSAEKLKKVTPEQALAHPIWDMGAKISVDSASMMNKGLEVIEASILFCLPQEDIRVIIHPQSIVHCLTEFADGSAIAQLSPPDMKPVIHQALSYPHYLEYENPKPLRLTELNFREVAENEFPGLELARRAARERGAQPAAMNAANEAAVSAFLAKRISFDRMAGIIEKVMDRFVGHTLPDCADEILALTRQSKSYAEEFLKKC